MAQRLPPLNGLRTFIAAARSCSFTQAAEELFVTPAAVSRSIRSLEDHLGCTLFHRLHREVALTKEGQFYFESLSDIFDRMAEATQNLIAQRQKRPLVVCGYPSLMMKWLVPRWSQHYQEDSGIELSIVTTLTHNVEFEKNKVDAALLTDSPEYRNCVSEKLFTSDLIPVCKPGFLPDGATAANLELWQDKLLHSETRPHDWARWAAVNPVGKFEPYRGKRFESSNLMYEAAMTGLGIAIGVRDVLTRELASGALVIPFPETKPAQCPIYLIRPEVTEMHPHFAGFRQWLVEQATHP